jgi:hypothetical protein
MIQYIINSRIKSITAAEEVQSLWAPDYCLFCWVEFWAEWRETFISKWGYLTSSTAHTIQTDWLPREFAMTSQTSGSTRIRRFISKFPKSCDKNIYAKDSSSLGCVAASLGEKSASFRRAIAPSFSRSNRRIGHPVALVPADKALRSFPTTDGPLSQRHSVTTTTTANSHTACIFILERFPSSLAVPKFGAKSSVSAWTFQTPHLVQNHYPSKFQKGRQPKPEKQHNHRGGGWYGDSEFGQVEQSS